MRNHGAAGREDNATFEAQLDPIRIYYRAFLRWQRTQSPLDSGVADNLFNQIPDQPGWFEQLSESDQKAVAEAEFPDPDFDALWEKHLDQKAWERSLSEPDWAR